jgi:hypothetical protein
LHLDEVAVVIAGVPFCLWRAVDSEGVVLDLRVQRRRDKAAAVTLTRKLLKEYGSLAPSTLSCARKRLSLLDRERKRGSRPSRCRGQQNSPSFCLLFQIAADSIGLRGGAPTNYPILKNPRPTKANDERAK